MSLMFVSFIFNISALHGMRPISQPRAITCPAINGAQFCDLKVLNNLVVNKLCASGNTQFSGDLITDGNAQITGNLTVDGSAQINGPLNVNGLINGITVVAQSGNVFFGNTLRVDQENGSDALGNRNGAPFLTISAALAQAQPGDVVWIFPGTYNEKITIPANVIVRGLAPHSVTIQQLNVTAPTDLVTMHEGSFIYEVSLLLTSSMHVDLRAIVVPRIGLETPTIISSTIITVDNSNAGAGTSNVYGVYFTGLGDSPLIADVMLDGSITVVSTGNGAKRGILVDSSSVLEVIIPLIQVFGGTNSMGIEVNNPAAIVACQSGAVGGDTADISQTQGMLDLASTYLINSTANGLGFTTLIYPSNFIWGDPDTPIGGSQTLYLRPGTGGGSATPIFIGASQKFLAKRLSVRVIVPPGIGQSTTWTVQRNSADTALSVTLTDNNLEAARDDISIHFDNGDKMSIKMVTSAGAMTGDALVIVDIY